VILHGQFTQAQAESKIQLAIERCWDKKVPIGWVIGSSTNPAKLAESLLAHGFMHFTDNPGMAVDLQK
jgi:hypothetical protein